MGDIEAKKQENLDNLIDRKWEERSKALYQVKMKLRNGWRNDDEVVEQYFQACVLNWKVYTGPRTPLQALKVQALYKQAIYGDCTGEMLAEHSSVGEENLLAWKRMYGTPKNMAKRRYITFLSEINALLIDVMPDEKPPEGFPLDRTGHVICAKCNTKVGCTRPILDHMGIDLRKQLLENEELHEPASLSKWVKNALSSQQCVWGKHQAISKAQARSFMLWFDRAENRGFFAYDSSPIMAMVKELVVYHYEVTYDMQQHKEEYSVQDYNTQTMRALQLKEVYQQLSGEEFLFEIPCTRTNKQCEDRRKAENGKNHFHPVELEPPTQVDVATYQEAIELRMQCQRLGIDPTTGVVADIAQRCAIYRERIAEYFKQQEIAAQARKRNESRAAIHAEEKIKVLKLSKDMITRQCWDACHTNRPDRCLVLVRRGCDPNEESPRGLTPLLCMVLTEAPVETIEQLVALKVDMNLVNRYGFTALMMACRLKDTKMIHVFLRNGAAAMQHGGRRGKRRTALHWCAVHGSEEEAKILVDYVRDGPGDALRVSRLLDAPSEGGDTALMLAARIRNGLLCRTLASLGANTSIRNDQGRNASYIARHAGWVEIAEWLDTKVGSGVGKIETFSDLQLDRKLRYGSIKANETLQEFGKQYLKLIQGRSGQSPFGPPSLATVIAQKFGKRGQKELQDFVDHHQLFVNFRNAENIVITPDPETEDYKAYLGLKEKLDSLVESVRKGIVAPNVEVGPKPLPLTPLLCAVILSDMRSINLLTKEGANLDHPNRNGTTALMVAAQLNNIEVLVELLTLGSDMSAVDNEGYTALAYASSLPLPKLMARNSVDVIMDDDVDGTKRLCSASILKTAQTGGVEDLKELLVANAQQADPEAVEQHYRILRLLESYGLTRMESSKHVTVQTYTSAWRVGNKVAESNDEKQQKEQARADSPSQHSSDSFSSSKRSNSLDSESGDGLTDAEFLRCPICTLIIPCIHFFKGAVLRRYFKRQSEAEERAKTDPTANVQVELDPKKGKKSDKKIRLGDKKKEILVETHLDDRNADRSLALANRFRPREIAVVQQRLALEAARDEVDRAEAARLLALENETVHWIEHYNKYGDLVLTNSVTKEAWTRYTDPMGKHYYHNEETNVSTWDPPDKDEGEDENDNRIGDVATSVASPQPLVVKAEGALVIRENATKLSSQKLAIEVEPPTEDLSPFGPRSVLKKPDAQQGSDDHSGTNKKEKRRVRFVLEEDPVVEEVAEGKVPLIDELIAKSGVTLATESAVKRSAGGAETSDLVVGEFAVQQVDVASGFQPLVVAKSDADTSSPMSESEASISKSSPSPAELSIFKPRVLSKDEVIGENPVPLDTRKVVMFTDEQFDRHGVSDGLISTRRLSPVGGAKSATDIRQIVKQAASSSGKSKKRRKSKRNLIDMNDLPTVQISGWTFVGLSLQEFLEAPVATVNISLKTWSSVVEHIRKKFMDEWLPEMKMETVVDVQSGQISSGRCYVCNIGFVRTMKGTERDLQSTAEGEEEGDENGNLIVDRKRLCLPCLIRDELFATAKQIFPAEFDVSRSLHWPFIKTRPRTLRSQKVITKSQLSALPQVERLLTIETMLFGPSEPTVPTISEESAAKRNLTIFEYGSIGGKSDSIAKQMTASQGIAAAAEIEARQSQDLESKLRSGLSTPSSGRSIDSNTFTSPRRQSSAGSFRSKSPTSAATSSSPARMFSRFSPSFNSGDRLGPSSASFGLRKGSQSPELSKSPTRQMSSLISLESSGIQSVVSMQSEEEVPTENVQGGIERGDFALLPLLVAKGHFDHVERSFRVCFAHAEKENGRFEVLPKLQCIAAETYKLMGLWPLAVGLLMDRADLRAAVYGYEHKATIQAICQVSSCLRKMGCGHLASMYIRSIVRKLENKYAVLEKSVEHPEYLLEIAEDLKGADFLFSSRLKKQKDVWKRLLTQELPQRDMHRKIFQQRGLGALYEMFSSPRGPQLASRLAFSDYCDKKDRVGLGSFASFVNCCIRLRACDDPEVYHYLLHNLLHKQLSATLIGKSEVARLYPEVTKKQHGESISQFLRRGTPCEVEIFDSLLLCSLKCLSLEYQSYFTGSGRDIVLTYTPSIWADATQSSALLIQSMWRTKTARSVLSRMRSLVAMKKLGSKDNNSDDDD